MKIFIPKNVPSSKNSRVWTGKFFIVSKSVQKWRKETAQYWESLKIEWIRMSIDKPTPIRLSITFVRGNKHKFDFINPCQTIMDEMVKWGWLEDDNADIVIPVFEPYQYDKNNPGVWLSIL